MSVRKIASQNRVVSLIESLTNIVVGLVINITAQVIIFPLFGIYITLETNLKIAVIFTVISLIRSFSLRRFFNWLHVKDL